jgi:murein DD-endopeptidase MepM/ murein hydrolase activator NlpD
VHAALDGYVVSAVDGVSERRWLHPVVETFAVLRNTVAFGRALRRGERLDPARLAGNHVIVGSSDTYALYAHLAPDSVTVRKGDTVVTGQPFGRVGHTGNSTAPHLHFHLMDRSDPFTANGVPCAFAAYLVRDGERWVPVENGEPDRWQRIRSVS